MPKLKESFVKSIFATDAVGFSKLVSKNEYETLASLKECLQIISQYADFLWRVVFFILLETQF